VSYANNNIYYKNKGGNRGIGLAIVKALLESDGGPYHIYMGSRDLKRGEEIAAKLPTHHGNTVSAVQLDITSSPSVASAVAAVEAGSGRLDILVNNAGVNLDNMSDQCEKMRAIYEINVIGPSRLTDAFRALLVAKPPQETTDSQASGAKAKTSGGGKKIQKRIVNVTSELGSVSSRWDPSFISYGQLNTAYRCSKAALGMLTACHAHEFKDFGVKVSAFDPGWAATECGGLDPAALLKMGAVDPRVSGLACRDVIEGKRDHEGDVILRIHGDTVPW